MNTNAYPETALWRKSPLPHHATWWSSANAEAVIEFGRFRVLLRRRRLLVDGVPVEFGTRAFDLLLVLLGADGALVTKNELLNRVWPDIVVSEENLKVQISALRKALGADRNLIRTEFGRGYRFTGALGSNAIAQVCRGPVERSCGLSGFASAELPAIAPVWFQFELVRALDVAAAALKSSVAR
jgi:DNA-binding winged helix-turn-helix (wHTH) protein